MKLYLSSYRLGDNPQALADLAGSNKKAAVIANAMDFLTDQDGRKESVDREIADLEALGLQPAEVDLRKYFGKPDELKEKLSEYGMVWVRGGNTFILRRAYAYSGFDELLKEKLPDPDFVYAGYSAGICILSPSLKGLDIVDDPNLVPEGYEAEIIWEGLDLVDYAFAPHYLSNHPEAEAVSRLVEYNVKNGIAYKALRDGEVIISQQRFLLHKPQ